MKDTLETILKAFFFIGAMSWFYTTYKVFHGYQLELWEAVLSTIATGIFLLDMVITKK